MYSSSEEDYDLVEIHLDERNPVVSPFHYGNRYSRRGWIENKDSYFLKIQQSVTEQENKSAGLNDEDEKRLFGKIKTYLQKPFAIPGLLTLQRLAFIPPSVSADRLKELAKIICRNIFNPLSDDEYITEYIDFCKAFAYLRGSTDSGICTFEKILISNFLDELPKNFNYSHRLMVMLENRDIPLAKKEEWLQRQIREYTKVFEVATKKSTKFLSRMFHLFPEIVYRVVEFLLKSRGKDALFYLHVLLESIRSIDPYYSDEQEVTDIYEMKVTHWERNKHVAATRAAGPPCPLQKENFSLLLKNITSLVDQNYWLTNRIKEAIRDDILDNPVIEHCAQDYIKYCIKDCLHFEKFELEDDFTIDDDDLYDCKIYTLRSKDFTCPGGMLFWKGLKVKTLTKKSKNPQQKPWRRNQSKGQGFIFNVDKLNL